MVTSRQKALEPDLAPLASIETWGCAGVDPRIIGTRPVPASRRALSEGPPVGAIALVEAGTAFASQPIAVARELHLDVAKTHVDGGAIALGPASGVQVLVPLLHELKRKDVRRGLATLCIGGGQGTALVVER